MRGSASRLCGQRLEGRRSAGPSPGVNSFTVSTKTDAPRGWFSGSLRRVAVFGPYRSAPGGRAGPAFSPGTAEYPPRPNAFGAYRSRRGRSLFEARSLIGGIPTTPLHPPPPLARSQALRALRAAGRGECGTPLDRVGQNGARNGRGVEKVGEFRRSHRSIRPLPGKAGEVDRMRSSRDGGALEGVPVVTNPSTATRSRRRLVREPFSTEDLPSREAPQPSTEPPGPSRRGMARMACTRARARPVGVGSTAAI